MIKYKIEQLEKNTKVKCDCKPPKQAILKVTLSTGEEFYLCRKALKLFVDDYLKNKGMIENETNL